MLKVNEAGTSILMIDGEGHRVIMPGKGKNWLWSICDDPELDKQSLGPSAFDAAEISRYRDQAHHQVLEVALATDFMLGCIAAVLQMGPSVLWVMTRERHEADWCEWLMKKTKPNIMHIIAHPEGNA